MENLTLTITDATGTKSQEVIVPADAPGDPGRWPASCRRWACPSPAPTACR